MLLSDKQKLGLKELEPLFGEILLTCSEYEIEQWPIAISDLWKAIQEDINEKADNA